MTMVLEALDDGCRGRSGFRELCDGGEKKSKASGKLVSFKLLRTTAVC